MENNIQNNNPEAGEKTFTQDDVNRIVGERLAKEKNKTEQDFSKREQELQQREIHMTAKEMLSEKGLSVKLIDALNCTDMENLEKSISIIEETLKEYKEVHEPIFKGAVPADSSDIDLEDVKMRKAMKLE